MKTKEELADWLREQNSDLLLRLYKYYVSDIEVETIHKMDDLQRVCGNWQVMNLAKAIDEGAFDYTDSYFIVSTDKVALYSFSSIGEAIIAVIGYRDFAGEILNGFPTGAYKFPELSGFLFGDCYVPVAIIRRSKEIVSVYSSRPYETLEEADKVITALRKEYDVIVSWIIKNDVETIGITTTVDRCVRINRIADLR